MVDNPWPDEPVPAIGGLSIFDGFTLRMYQRMMHGEPPRDVEAAAAYYLSFLERSERSLDYRASLSLLLRDWMALDEESALVPAALEVQRRVFALTPTDARARYSFRFVLQLSPVARLWAATLNQCGEDGATEIRLDFRPDRLGRLLFEVSGSCVTREPMLIPGKLVAPVRGWLVRTEAIGFAKLRPFMDQTKTALPADLSIEWEGDAVRVGLLPDSAL